MCSRQKHTTEKIRSPYLMVRGALCYIISCSAASEQELSLQSLAEIG